ncbi:redoxin family protein [Demequina activiva]|uniref:Thiol:disulfide interchange protein n=1 Tax=Demequina activiva TaxID=1582364 RepID=A0A919UFT0_9MICO|nr:redoxin family protein [Demequina activiva]GIG54057.1 thiol:disulfide interchange protein [Demequina activiva]
MRLRMLGAAAVTSLVLAGCTASSESATTATTDATTGSAERPAESSPPAQPGPFDFTAATAAGGTLEGESLKHRDVILWFWAPWCPTCLVEGQDYVADAIAQMPEGVELVGIAGRITDENEVGEFLDFTGTGDATHVLDEDGTLWADFGVALQPAFLFVNDDGTYEKGGAGLTTEDILAQAERLAES